MGITSLATAGARDRGQTSTSELLTPVVTTYVPPVIDCRGQR